MQSDTANTHHFKRLLSYIKPYKAAFIASIIAMIGYAGVDSLFIYSIKPLIDEGLTNKNPEVLTYAPLFVLAAFVVRGICNFVSTYCLAWVGSNVVMTMRQALFEHMIKMPVPYFDNQTTGQLISKITYDTEQVANAASKTLIIIVKEGAFVIGMLALMFYQSWQLSAIFLVIGPIIGVVVSFVSKRFRKISRQIQNAMGTITTSAEQMLNGHKVVLTFGGQKLEAERFYKVNNQTRRQNMKMVAASAISVPVIQIIASFALATVLLVASMDSMLETLTPGTFTIVITSMIMLLRPLKQLTSVNSQFQKGMAASASIFSVLDEEIEKDTGEKTVDRVSGDIKIEGLTFTYQGKEAPALKELDLHVEPGKTVALVGRSGSGKSTITSLLTRFYDYENGSIRVDGIELHDFTLANLRSHFAIVSQHVTLFDDTIANNIAYACDESVTREQIIEAAKSAHVIEFTDQMPDGLDTQVGENGVMLSGGQRQRIAIARALLRNAPILILDEATSALDTESERHIQGALEELQKNRTCLVIAHRLSTIENADKIVVLDGGEIKEQGTHTELLSKDGAYAQLHKLQFGD
ncbi:lipid A ABC transporter ATP-binding protein/permease MsbA [Corallincola platygyrae]|uniref:Lipid A ABC transporter ATP-binding protein/permease MsbA n=1 Tax=Corallincola platygyrae TaxID=1193278 RepID=A0ABW4XNA5_9GAMM